MLLDLDTEEKIKALAESSLAMTTGTQLFNIEDVARRSLLQGLSGGAGVSGAASGSRYAAQAAAQYNLTVNTGVGDPNAIAEAIDQLLREANSRGTLTNGVLGIA
jgi:ribosomal protein S11